MNKSLEQAEWVHQESTTPPPTRAFAFVIEPDEERRNRLTESLPNNGVNVRAFTNFDDAKKAIDEGIHPDICIAHDSSIPVISHLLDNDVPVIITGKTRKTNGEAEPSMVAAFLDIGADFYISSESSPESVAAHVRASLRRTQPQIDKGMVKVGNGVCDVRAGRFMTDGKETVLTSTEGMLLAYLVRNRGKVLSREDILRDCWGEEYINEKEHLRVWISRLRLGLEELGERDLIQTIYGFGYTMPNPDNISSDEYRASSEEIVFPEEMSEADNSDKRIKVLVISKNYSSSNYLRIGLPYDQFCIITVDNPEEAERILKDRQDFVLVEEGIVIKPNSRGIVAKYITLLKNQHNAPAALDAGAFSAVREFEDIDRLADLMITNRHKELKSEKQPTLQCVEGVEIDLESGIVTRDGKEIELTTVEYRILMHLAQNPKSIVAGADIIAEIWGPESTNYSHYLRAHLVNLRKKIGVPNLIATSRGLGYMLNITD